MQKIKEQIKNEKVYSILIILIASIFICLPLLSQNLDVTYDDGIQHITRIIGTFQGLQNGNSTVFENFCNGFGYSWNMFYSPITAYFPLIFKLLGVGFAVCIKLFMFTVVFLSGLFMYIFVKKITKNNNIALISSIFYVLAPYRFTDMYIRNALAELTSFMFLPLVFLGLFNLFNNEIHKKILQKNVVIPLVIGGVGLILTHTIIAIYTAIFAFIYVLISIIKLIKKNNKEKLNKIDDLNKKQIISILKQIGICLVLIIVITSFFWAPLLEARNSADYEVFKPGRMERTDVLVAYKLDFYRLFITFGKDYMVYDIGLIVLLGLILTPLAIKKVKETKYYKLYLFMLISGIVSCIMTLRIFPFENLPSTLKMLQFSFRMLEFSSFFFAFIAGINIYVALKKFKLKYIFIILGAMCILTLTFIGKAKYIENYNEQRLIDTVPVTSETGRIHAGCASFEYLPSKAFENRSYIETRNQDAIVLEGNVRIENAKKDNSKMSFNVVKNEQLETSNATDDLYEKVDEEQVADNSIKIELPYIYYPGYNATIENVGSVQTYETENGFVGITIPNIEGENLKVNVEYSGTFIMTFTKIISTIGACLFLFYILRVSFNEENK